MSPRAAVALAAILNFVGAFISLEVAATVANGIVEAELISTTIVFGGLIGAIAWDLITWYFGLPTSSSHALLGGYAGAGMAKVAMTRGFSQSFDALNPDVWFETLAFILIAPLLGMLLAFLIMMIIYWTFRNASPKRMDVYFRKLQLVSAAIFSYAHGTNDAQKTMGIITGVLFTSQLIPSLDVPIWVIFAAHA